VVSFAQSLPVLDITGENVILNVVMLVTKFRLLNPLFFPGAALWCLNHDNEEEE
jgi:hypothetical protein